MPLSNVAHLLNELMGLDVASIGRSAIARAIRLRQRACDLEGSDEYWDRVRTCPVEQQALIEIFG